MQYAQHPCTSESLADAEYLDAAVMEQCRLHSACTAEAPVWCGCLSGNMAFQQLAPAQQVSQVELPRTSHTAELPVHTGSHMQPPQELDHALLHTGWDPGVQSPCMKQADPPQGPSGMLSSWQGLTNSSLSTCS